MIELPIEERRVRSHDGTDIAYHVIGEGIPIVLCNGLGGSYTAWSHTINALKDRYSFISWDYRGLYESGHPSDPEAVTVEDSARDGLAVMEAEGIERAALFGWSMGVQIAIEMFRMRPEAVPAMALLNGVAGRIFESVLDVPYFAGVAPVALRTLGHFSGVASAVMRGAAAIPGGGQVVKSLGVTAPTVDDEIFEELFQGVAKLDMAVYMRTMKHLGAHDAWDVLETIDVPTLVVAGEKDIMTPPSAARRMAARIRGSELLVVPGATHYLAIETPEILNARIDAFLAAARYDIDAA